MAAMPITTIVGATAAATFHMPVPSRLNLCASNNYHNMA
jgi:hypothetical protein